MDFNINELMPGIDVEKYLNMAREVGYSDFELVIDFTDPAIKLKNGKRIKFSTLEVLHANLGYRSTKRVGKISEILVKYDMVYCKCGQPISPDDATFTNKFECSEIKIICSKCQCELFFAYGDKINKLSEFFDQLAFMLDKRDKDDNWTKF